MEAVALGPWLEGAVERLIPPAAREAVLGDLRESCCGRGDYLREIVKAAPYVIASQMMRHLNLPVLMLQGALVFWFFNGWVVALALPLLMLREAYQPLGRPDPRKALRGALFLAFATLFVSFLTRMPASQALVTLLLAGPLSLLLCGLRTSVIVNMDRFGLVLPAAMPLPVLGAYRADFLVRQRRRHRLEILALGVAAPCWPRLVGPSLGLPLSAVFLAAALYLVHGLLSGTPEAPADFMALRHRYVEEVRGDQQLRRLLCWLWVVPGLLMVQAGIVSGGMVVASPEKLVFRAVLAVLLCFGAGALNREERGRVQEEISLLDRLRETPSILA